MKKKIILLLILLCSLFTVKNVYADTKSCTYLPYADYTRLTGITVDNIFTTEIVESVNVGDKIWVKFAVNGNVDSNTEFRLTLKNVSVKYPYIVAVYLKDITLTSEGNGNVYKGYYTIEDSFQVGSEWKYDNLQIETKDKKSSSYSTPSGKEVDIYTYNCATFVFNPDDLSNGANLVLITNNFKNFNVVAKEETQNIEPAKIVSITTDKSEYYVGEEIKYTVTATEPIKSIQFEYSTTKAGTGYIINPIISSTGTTFTAVGHVPSAIFNYPEGKFTLSAILAYDLNGNEINYSKYKINEDKERGIYWNPLSFDLSFNLKNQESTVEEQSDVTINSLKFSSSSANIGTKVPVTFDAKVASTSTIKSVHINFADKTTKAMFSSYLKSLDKDSYFVVPSVAKEGTYAIDSIVFTVESENEKIKTIVVKNTDDKYKEIFDQTLTVAISNNENVLYYSTEDLSDVVFETIKNSQENSIIIIDADQESTISSSLFDAIKGTQRQLIINYKNNEWIINGVDIEASKTIDVSMSTYEIKDAKVSNDLKIALDDGSYVVEFTENGELPGTTLIRLKANDLFAELDKETYYVYYLDENNNKLNKVAVELQKSYDGYLEFYISHNSKYVITTKKVTDEKVLGEEEKILEDNKEFESETTTKPEEKKESETNMLYAIIGAGSVVIIVLIIVIICMSKKKPKVEDKPIVSEPLEEEKKEE